MSFERQNWQFGVKHLLFAMTFVSVLLMSALFEHTSVLIVLLALFAAVWSLARFWPFRAWHLLAVMFVVSLLFGFACYITQ
jgi:hypothetical protein